MAEKEVVYKPVIDTAEFQSQLLELQNQLNTAMGATPFGGSFGGGAVMPAAPAAAFASPTAGFQDFSQNVANSVSMDALRQQSEAVKFGLGNISADITQTFNAVLPRFSMPDLDISRASGPDFRTEGFFKSTFRSMGFGYDPNDYGMTRAEYKRKAEDRLGSAEVRGDLFGFGAGLLGGSAIGATVGATFGGIPGFIAGTAADLTIGAAVNWMNAPNVDRDRIADYLNETSWRFNSGEFGKGASLGAASTIQNYFNSSDFRKLELDKFQGEQVVSTYLEAGGFDSVKSAEELATKVTTMMSKVQRMAQVLGVPLEQAAQLAPSFEVMGKGDALGFAYKVDSWGKTAGLSNEEMLGVAKMGQSIAVGMGVAGSAGAIGTMELAAALKEALREGLLGMGTIGQLGGQTNAAAMLAQQGLGFAMGPMGLAYQAASLGGVAPGMSDIGSTLAAAAGAINSPRDIISLYANQDKFVAGLGANGAEYLNAITALRVAQSTMPGGLEGMSPDEIAQTMVFTGGAPNKATGLAMTALLATDRSEAPYAELMARVNDDAAEAQYQRSPLGRFKGRLAEVRSFFGDIRLELAAPFRGQAGPAQVVGTRDRALLSDEVYAEYQKRYTTPELSDKGLWEALGRSSEAGRSWLTKNNTSFEFSGQDIMPTLASIAKAANLESTEQLILTLDQNPGRIMENLDELHLTGFQERTLKRMTGEGKGALADAAEVVKYKLQSSVKEGSAKLLGRYLSAVDDPTTAAVEKGGMLTQQELDLLASDPKYAALYNNYVAAAQGLSGGSEQGLGKLLSTIRATELPAEGASGAAGVVRKLSTDKVLLGAFNNSLRGEDLLLDIETNYNATAGMTTGAGGELLGDAAKAKQFLTAMMQDPQLGLIIDGLKKWATSQGGAAPAQDGGMSSAIAKFRTGPFAPVSVNADATGVR